MARMDEASAASHEDMIAQAEAAVAALRDSYRVQLASDVAALEAVWACLGEGKPLADVFTEVHAIAHNIKGQGGSFGYDLVTEIGASLCDYIRGRGHAAPNASGIAEIHIRMLRTVSDNDISGDGGEMGRRIVSKLQTLTA